MPSTNQHNTTGEVTIEKQHCALVSKEQREDPIGSAAAHKRYLFVEVDLPWEYKVEDSRKFPPGLKESLAQCAEQGEPFRFLAFDPGAAPSPEGYRRVMYYYQPSVPFAFFEKREYLIPEGRLLDLVQALLVNQELLSSFSNDLQTTGETRDFFVCTHGSHDLCCGKLGFPIYQTILDQYVLPSNGKFRVWRTSHFGGHRHAPTLIDLPEGRYWAQLTPEKLDTLILRKGNFADIARNYRGWGAIGSFEQAAEREMFLREGWSWIDYAKQASLLNKGEDSAQVRIDYYSADRSVLGAYEAEVITGDPIQVGGCGNGLMDARQLEVASVHKVTEA